MNLSMENLINQKLAKIFEKLELDTKFAVVKVSDRPDLSDFQCNGDILLRKTEFDHACFKFASIEHDTSPPIFCVAQ